MHEPHADANFFLITCRFTHKFLCAIDLTTLVLYDKIELWCKHCGHHHELTLAEDGNFKVRTY